MRSAVAEYELVGARSLDSALQLLASGEGWRPIAGGTDLMVLLNAGKLAARRFVSLRQLDELRTISITNEQVSIGATVTYTQIRNHPVLRQEFPLLCQAASWTGGVANQNQGTLGGNIANASPAADSLPPLLVHHAELLLASARGTHTVAYADFHSGYKQFAMTPEELIVAIRLPRREGHWRSMGRKVGTRRAQAISKVSFAATAQVDGGIVSDLSIALGSVAPKPMRCLETERIVRGSRLNDEVIAEARQAIAAEIAPITDLRSTASYRSTVAGNLLTAFLESLR